MNAEVILDQASNNEKTNRMHELLLDSRRMALFKNYEEAFVLVDETIGQLYQSYVINDETFITYLQFKFEFHRYEDEKIKKHENRWDIKWT